MSRGMLHRLIDVLMDVSKALGTRCECAEVERMAVLVHRVMSRQSRQFHTLGHVFGFLDGADAETALAAVFHDLVYFQVDDGLPPELEVLLGSSLSREGKDLLVARDIPADDLSTQLCLDIFGFERGRILPVFAGLNEFLSALAMMKLLVGRLPTEELVAVAACIEASIPFRGPDAGGRSAAEGLAARLESMAAMGLFPSRVGGIDTIMHRAIAFGNFDVRDFSLEDPGEFLTNTWKLLPESNAALRWKGAFSIHEYRLALEKMRGFFLSLDPARVYHSWHGIPDVAEMNVLETKTRRNLARAITYMKAKLLAAGLLEAAAEISGGDAPMALFMGDLPGDAEDRESLASHLPPTRTPAWLGTDTPVYRLLRDGRLDESSFDLKNSPLALFFFESLEPARWGWSVKGAEDYFKGGLGAGDFLSSLPRRELEVFIRACAAMVPTRKTLLEAWFSGTGGR